MLLNEEKTQELVNQIIRKAQELLAAWGKVKVDPENGFTHREYCGQGFVLVEHQRQQLNNGTIKTNGLDLWQVVDGNARKMLSVNYVPFEIKFFYKSGRARWINTFLNLSVKAS